MFRIPFMHTLNIAVIMKNTVEVTYGRVGNVLSISDWNMEGTMLEKPTPFTVRHIAYCINELAYPQESLDPQEIEHSQTHNRGESQASEHLDKDIQLGDIVLLVGPEYEQRSGKPNDYPSTGKAE